MNRRGRATKSSKDPNWARDELVLALELYFRRGRKQLDAEDPDVIELSEFLNDLRIHPSFPRTDTFRNPNGVSMKLGNFLSLDPHYGGTGLRRGGRLERELWNELAESPDQLIEAARAVRQKKPPA